MDMLMMLIAIIIAVSAFIINKYVIQPKKIVKNYIKVMRNLGYKVYELPVQPFKITIYDHFSKYEKEKKDAFYQSKNLFPGYDIIVTNHLHRPHVIFANWKLIKELFHPEKVYMLPKVTLGLQVIRELAGKGFFFSEGEAWKNKRKMMSKIFHFDFVTAQTETIKKVCDRIFDNLQETYWAAHPEHRQSKYIQAHFYKIFVKIFIMITSTSFLGQECINEKLNGDNVQDFFLEVTKLCAQCSFDKFILIFGTEVFKLGLRKKYRQLKTKMAEMKGLCSLYLQKTKNKIANMTEEQKKNPNNIMESLFILKEQNQADAQVYNDSELSEELMNFLVAGSDITSVFASTMILNIFENKQVQERLMKEIDQVVKTDEDITVQNMKKLTYIDYIQYEGFRMFRPGRGQFDRLLSEDTLLGDIPISKDTVLNYNPKAVFYNPDIFEQPSLFKPERWEKDNLKIHPNEMLTLGFSGGPRGCIGKYLALLQTKIMIVKFMRRYRGVKEHGERIYSFNLVANVSDNVVSFYKK